MDDELIAKAAEVDRQFNQIATTVGTALKSAIVSAASSLADLLDSFRAFEAQKGSTLEARQGELMREKAELHARLGKNPRGDGKTRERIAELDAEENEIIAELSKRNSPPAWAPKQDTWTPPRPPAPSCPARLRAALVAAARLSGRTSSPAPLSGSRKMRAHDASRRRRCARALRPAENMRSRWNGRGRRPSFWRRPSGQG